MKTLALIALIMVLGLSGCASSGTSGLMKEVWTEYLNDPRTSDWELIKEVEKEYRDNPGTEDWELTREVWKEYWFWSTHGVGGTEDWFVLSISIEQVYFLPRENCLPDALLSHDLMSGKGSCPSRRSTIGRVNSDG